MKWFLVLWLLGCGIGLSFHIVKERRLRVLLLQQMVHSLRQLAYFMYQWKMPVEEAFRHTIKEEKGVLQQFLQEIYQALCEKKTENLGLLWQEKSALFLKDKKLSQEVGRLWSDSFLYLPMEPVALNRRLSEQAEKLFDYTKELQKQYQGEQRLVFTMGFFGSAFLCLILW